MRLWLSYGYYLDCYTLTRFQDLSALFCCKQAAPGIPYQRRSFSPEIVGWFVAQARGARPLSFGGIILKAALHKRRPVPARTNCHLQKVLSVGTFCLVEHLIVN
jgi:hypothetical protein